MFYRKKIKNFPNIQEINILPVTKVFINYFSKLSMTRLIITFNLKSKNELIIYFIMLLNCTVLPEFRCEPHCLINFIHRFDGCFG